MQMLSVLGSTGSIGTQVLDVVRRMPDRFRVRSLAAGRNLDRLARQTAEFHPAMIAIQEESDRSALQALLQVHAPAFAGDIAIGPVGLAQLASDPACHTVIVGLVGLVGLAPSLKALQAGKRLLTANKETFVSGGHLVQPYLSQIVPIDSEHVAIHQCLKNEPQKAVETLYLTASGGPFRTLDAAALQTVSREAALKHPNWVMGRKITVDSATMMNKGLEIIEAHWLFGVPYERIQVVVHPESFIHSGVGFVDGSILVQMGAPDMHGPIQYAMTYPERLPNPEPGTRLDLLSLSRLNFEPPDPARFPCIRLAYEAGELGGSATAALNGADEVAVSLFLEGKIAYCDIARLLEATLKAHAQDGVMPSPTLAEVQAVDAWARAFVRQAAMPQPILPLV